MKIKNKLNFNGKLELYRFIFTIIIILFHIQKTMFPGYTIDLFGLKFGFFSRGFLAVEFFFILSGILMASSVSREKNGEDSLTKQTINFILKKAKAIWPYHIPAFIIAIITILVVRNYNIFESIGYLITSIPTFFFVNKIGFHLSSPIGGEWYISVMLISMLIIYPILKKNFEMFSKIIAPLIFLIIIGLLFKNYGGLGNTSTWTPFGYKCLYRGIAEICLGIFSFQLATSLGNLKIKKFSKYMLTLIEIGALAFVLIGTCIKIDSFWQFYIVMAMTVLIIIAFSKQSCGLELLNNSFIKFLGFISLPLFITHQAAINIVNNFDLILGESNKLLILKVFIITGLFTYICILFTKIYDKINFKKLI